MSEEDILFKSPLKTFMAKITFKRPSKNISATIVNRIAGRMCCFMAGLIFIFLRKRNRTMYRKVFIAENAEDLNVRLPDEYLHKGIEVIAFDLEEAREEIRANKKRTAETAIEFFKTIQIDMSDLKFDRDEANER